MDFFKSKKPKSFQQELIDYESTTQPPGSIYEMALGLKNLIQRKKIKNIEQIEEYIFEKYPLIDKLKDYNVQQDKILTALVFYFWLGGGKCIPQDNTECLNNLNHFYKIYSKYKYNFEPFLGIDLSLNQRKNILRNKAKSVGQMGEILITLNHAVPGGFIIMDTIGSPYYWEPSTNQKPLLDFIEDIKPKAESNKTKYDNTSSSPPLKRKSKYFPPEKGQECINETVEDDAKKLIQALEKAIQDQSEEDKNRLVKEYKKMSIKIHPDKINNTNLPNKNKERCIELFKIFSDLLSS